MKPRWGFIGKRSQLSFDADPDPIPASRLVWPRCGDGHYAAAQSNERILSESLVRDFGMCVLATLAAMSLPASERTWLPLIAAGLSYVGAVACSMRNGNWAFYCWYRSRRRR